MNEEKFQTKKIFQIKTNEFPMKFHFNEKYFNNRKKTTNGKNFNKRRKYQLNGKYFTKLKKWSKTSNKPN